MRWRKVSEMKRFASKGYNYLFDESDGTFVRWGETVGDDPQVSPFGPEILDIEISTVCHGGCSFCYKSNKPDGKTMSLETFKKLFAKFPKNVMQIAFGIGDVYPEMFDIFKYCREQGVVPNVTINGKRMTSEIYDDLVKYCGAVAVSLYNVDECYTAVEELSKRGLKQINIHALLSHESYLGCEQVLKDALVDKRLVGKLNAVVFLWLKPKGERNVYHQLGGMIRLRNLMWFAERHKISIGFDSCSAPMVEKIMGQDARIEPCESTLFSGYIDVDCRFHPCSFCGDKGIDVLTCDDFLKDVWFHPDTVRFREKLQSCGRQCPIFKLG
jgi:MoaA/NifB/PqqE/SkfB family radical SAM enzyme